MITFVLAKLFHMAETTSTEQQTNTHTSEIPRTPLRFAFFIAKQSGLLGMLAILSVTLAQFAGVFSPYILKKIIDSANASSGVNTQEVFFWVLMFPMLVITSTDLPRRTVFFFEKSTMY